MVGVCFCYTSQMWAMNQWDYVLTSFAVDQVFILTHEDIEEDSLKITRSRPKAASSAKTGVLIKTAEDLPKNASLTVLAPAAGRHVKGKECLHGFQHPGNVVYMFGMDQRNLCEVELGSREPDHIVYVESESNELYAHVAAAIVLYDRKRKSLSSALRKRLIDSRKC